MRILLTGNRGFLGRVVERKMLALGWQVVGCDRATGHDIRDFARLRQQVAGCDAVVHLAVVANDSRPTVLEALDTNLVGTWNLLAAATGAGIRRFVFASSVNALGVFQSEALPPSFPIDDDCPPRPTRAYGLSKLFAEELCEAFSEQFDMTTICLRPVEICNRAKYENRLSRWQHRPASEWTPVWEYGAYIDVNDAADAFVRACTCEFEGHTRLILAANDMATATRLDARELTTRLAPSAPWSRPGATTVDSTRAQALLAWRPSDAWSEFLARHQRTRLKLPRSLRALRLRLQNRLRIWQEALS